MCVARNEVDRGGGKRDRPNVQGPGAVFDRRAGVFSAAALPSVCRAAQRLSAIAAATWGASAPRAESRKWHLLLGSSLTAMNVSPDKTTLVVGSHAGDGVEIDLTADRGRGHAAHERPREGDRARVFWNGHDPRIG
jgi:hypothetical protein